MTLIWKHEFADKLSVCTITTLTDIAKIGISEFVLDHKIYNYRSDVIRPYVLVRICMPIRSFQAICISMLLLNL